MAWDDSLHGGFSAAVPWIKQDALYKTVNVAAQREDPSSVWRFTQELIQLRKRIAGFAYADIRFVDKKRKDYFCWERVMGAGQSASQGSDLSSRTIRVEMNLSDERKALPTLKNADAQLVLCNYPYQAVSRFFEPYEVRIWRY
jgi:glycosidase